MIDDINAFQSEPAGTAASNEIGARLVETMVTNMLFIGTVLASGPIYHHNTLKNVTDFKTHSYEYYWNYPYRGAQWYLDE
jgi:peptide/nickel transport system substrate-binding protein